MRSAAPLPILLLAVAVAIVGAVRDDPQVLGVNEPGFLDAQAEITEVLSEPGAEEALGSSPVLEGEALAATGGFGSSASATGSVGATGSMGVPSATGAPGWVDIIALNPGELGAPCLGQETRGTCKPAHQCSTGTVVPDLCLTGLGIECCLPLPDTACRNARGKCMLESSCEGTALPGLCPGSEDVTCCVHSRTFHVQQTTTGANTFDVLDSRGKQEYQLLAISRLGGAGAKRFELRREAGGEVLGFAERRLAFSEVWEEKVPTFDIQLADGTHWLLSESPAGRLALHPDGHADAHATSESVEGTWSSHTEFWQDGHRLLALDPEEYVKSRFSYTLFDTRGTGSAQLDPRVAALTAIVWSSHELYA